MSTAILHYIHDPLCGWCYGAAQLVTSASAILTVQPHGGGMMAGPRRQRVSSQLRDYVMPHDRRISQLTGQPFGQAYFDGLLRDTTAVFDSEPPIAAMLAAQALAGRALDLLARLQTAHYVEGRRIAERGVLIEQAAAIGLAPESFASELQKVEGTAVQAHIADTRALMLRVGVQGFPSFVLEIDGRWIPLEHGTFLGQPAEFAEWLRRRWLVQPPASSSESMFACGPDGCAL